MHGSERDQRSLVFDLIEEFRGPFADRLVLAMLGRGLKPDIGVHGFLRTRIRRLLAQGFARSWNKKIRWIECYYQEHSAVQTASYLEMCKGWGLVATGGSDYHGPHLGRPNPLGTPSVPLAAYEQLKSLAAAG
jgi:hypothetical protein